ncbi:MAG: hypothetical protein IT361_09220 [Gemmatimonadaceae bacterium]|nr:hypothetical protein [Gemmatimonadaceae bacterium]
MLDPLSLLPFGLAARDGVLDGWPARQLVAAGVGVLRAHAPVARALARRRSAMLLPVGPSVLVALAASDGRGALFLDPATGPAQVARELNTARVGAVFSTRSFANLLPDDLPRVLLDDAPASATFVTAASREQFDLSMHEGISIEGDPDAEGSTEELLLAFDEAADPVSWSHRRAFGRVRAIVKTHGLRAIDRVLVMRASGDLHAFLDGEVSALAAGCRVTSLASTDIGRALDEISRGNVTVLVAPGASLAAMSAHHEHSAAHAAGALRRTILSTPANEATRRAWAAWSGLEPAAIVALPSGA